MTKSGQAEFDLTAAPTGNATCDPDAAFYEEVARQWRLPVGQRVRVLLEHHDLPELTGRLQLARIPELPLEPRQPLQLRIGKVDFTSRQIVSWICQE